MDTARDPLILLVALDHRPRRRG